MLQEWSLAVGYVLLASSLRTLIVAFVAGVALFAFRVRSSAVRHRVWSTVLIGMILMPVLPHVTPTLAIPVIPSVRTLARDSASLPVSAPVLSSPVMPTAPVTPALSSPAAVIAGTLVVEPARSMWPVAVLFIYGFGVVAFAVRLASGWREMRAIVRAGKPLILPDGSRILESTDAAAPFAAGVIDPVIVLSAGSSKWPREKLNIILAHERSHVRRCDPLIAFLSHLNHCVFWFHPLAWWLERRVALLAEHACDDVARREASSPRQYAEILLESADSVRRSGKRYARVAIGVEGTGNLERRIDRILRDERPALVARWHQASVLSLCVAAILATAACRTQPAPLKDNPQKAASAARWNATLAESRAIENLKPEQVADLGSAIRRNPDDLESLKKVLRFYAPDFSGKPIADAAQKIAIRRAYILRLIELHPDSPLAGSFDVQIFTTSKDPLADPEGYAQAKQRWLQQAQKPNAPAVVFMNAAYFFQIADKPLAEQMLLSAQKLDPGARVSDAIGDLYGFAILGSNAATPLNVVRSVSAEEARGPFARSVRAKLNESMDARLLYSAGTRLYLGVSSDDDSEVEAQSIAEVCLRRAAEIDAPMARARSVLFDLQTRKVLMRVRKETRGLSAGEKFIRVSNLSDSERLEVLPQLAMESYIPHENEPASESFENARKYGEDLLLLAARNPGDPNREMAIFTGNITLAAVAMRRGDKRTAVRYLNEAAKVSGSDRLSYDSGTNLYTKVCANLLKYGERQSVIDFLQHYSQINVINRDYLLQSARLIQEGTKPLWYPE
jgi:beta-lactamase regulating signal transducer with metallopeptidase domain